MDEGGDSLKEYSRGLGNFEGCDSLKVINKGDDSSEG